MFILYKMKTPVVFLLLAFVCSYIFASNEQPQYKFRRLTSLNGLPNNDIQRIYQGKDGYMWIASRNGLFQYDGYSVITYRSNLYNPELLSNNNICSVTEDLNQRIWIGTYNGLDMLDRKTGNIIQINRPEFINNTISAILVTQKGRVLLGTDQGLYEYNYDTDSCILYSRINTHGVFPETSVKSIIEDSSGHIWIGTWNNGLYRYDPSVDKYYSYPQMNFQNSAHIIYEDSRKQIWVGTWGGGLQVLRDAYDMNKVSWKTYEKQANKPNSILNNIIYSISEDIHSKRIWVGTRVGLSILQNEETGSFINYYADDSENSISGNEVNSIIRDNQGTMWLGLLRGGINMVSTKKPYFTSYTFESIKKKIDTNSVGCLFVDDSDDTLWLGFSGYGLVLYDRKNNKFKLPIESEEFGFERIPSILSMTKMASNGQIWIGVHNGGIFVYDKNSNEKKKIKEYPLIETPWISGHQIHAIFEDSDFNKWIGTNYGLTMVNDKFEYIRFDSLECDSRKLRSAVIVDILEGSKNEIWAASNNTGIYRITGKGKTSQDYKITSYTVSNGKLNSLNMSCVYKDKKGNIWAGSEGGGLNLYDRETDSFISVHKKWNLPGDAIYSIQEDDYGNLWLGTNSGLMKLHIQEDLKNASFRMYTITDGLLNNSFSRKAIFKTQEGEIFFGGNQGLDSFYPEKLSESKSVFPPIVVTDIKIHNVSWNNLDAKLRNEISEFTPEFTKEIRLDHKNNNFTIEFATLGYEASGQYTYAYKLEGFDSEWKYTDVSRRFAYYNNLTPGTYKFYLKTTNANGVWSNQIISFDVVILPPFWLTWWAYLIYTVVISAIIIFVYRMLTNRIKLENKLQLREIDQIRAEELNHAKLQFFTNITHELLTPLTIISASVDELKMNAPQYGKHYQVMVNNINRLIRLLQQILEFRKAESGNLRLKVSSGDLAAFVSNSIKSFQPLIKKKQMNLIVECEPSPFLAYFDPDKLDKILYNLLSNASKYNRTGGNISVKLNKDESGESAIIIVADDGMGMSKDAQKNLFKRFYEGDYRKFQTIGTGIGLSLIKDLVTLHGGEISVDSDEGKGTSFRVVFPITRNAFKEDEIDDTLMDIEPSASNDDNEYEEEYSEDDKSQYNVLLVEDNEDLLHLMVKLLGTDYNIFTATNGKEGLDIVNRDEIDLVVSDIMMPIMDGVELCKKIKNEFETSHIPVLLLTAKTAESDRINAYESGADAYLNKPFNLSLLHARIKNLLKARERLNKDFKKQLVFEARELNYTSIDEEFLQKAIDCVHNNLSDPAYDQAQFVKDMGTTRSTLFRKMKSLTGLSYVSFIRNIRLKEACRIMEKKRNIRISELAYAVGFNDPRYFSSCFKKEFGMLPREYHDKFTLEQDLSEMESNDDELDNLD